MNNLVPKIRRAATWVRYARSYDPRTRRTRVRGPATVQIQTIDRCNGACLMCPYSSAAGAAPAHVMDDGLYRKILDELRRAGTVQLIVLMLQNEPTLDRTFPDRVRVAREVFGQSVRIVTVTNGAPLTAGLIDELAACGIDHVTVSIDAIHEDTYGRIRPGLNFQRVMENTLSLAGRLGAHRVGVRFLRQRDNEGEEGAFAGYWRRQGIGVEFTDPTNRAGWLGSYERIRKPRPALWKRLVFWALNRILPACPLPFTSMNILWDGRAITCCHDWGPHDTVGDLSRQTLGEVWDGEKINHYRHLLRARRAGESLVCRGCSLSENFWKV